MHRFLVADGRMPLINLALVEMVHELPGSHQFKSPQTPDGTLIGPAVQLWFDDDRYIVVNSTLDQIEAMIEK